MFSNTLKKLRSKTHRTQKEIAKALGVAPTTYASWEQGKREPDQAATIRIADYFDVTLDYLYGRNETPQWAKQKDTIDLKSFLDKNLVGAFYDGDELTDEQRDKLKIALTQIFWDQRKKERSDTDDIDKGAK
ncbi:helix-turn-helix transcriptional regulator [Companilactobacillus paralimentarius]|uniref:helix-turn-helix transcriptional regulator n=1 Tax=Companilactobacillus paralimentarius TaxID=83526 RepID=UPI0037E07656